MVKCVHRSVIFHIHKLRLHHCLKSHFTTLDLFHATPLLNLFKACSLYDKKSLDRIL